MAVKLLYPKKRQNTAKVTNLEGRNLNELFTKGKKFFEELKPIDKIALIYHMDMDGVCSAALIHKTLEKLNVKNGTNISISKNIVSTYDNVENDLKTLSDFNKIIIVDIGVDTQIKNQQKKTSRSILLIDHHIIKRDLNSKSVIFINPRFGNEETYQPAAYIIYKLLSGLVDMKDVEWIAVLGIVSDLGYEDCIDVLKDWVKVKKKDELFVTRPGQISYSLLGASYELGFEKTLKILVEAKSMGDLEENEEVSEAFEKYERVFEEGKKEFWKNAEIVGNIIFSVIKPKYKRLGSPIINRISFERPENIIFLFEKRDGEYKIGVRHQSGKTDLGKLMKKCCGGGGHKQAAGGMIRIKDLEKFKKCVIKELKSRVR